MKVRTSKFPKLVYMIIVLLAVTPSAWAQNILNNYWQQVMQPTIDYAATQQQLSQQQEEQLKEQQERNQLLLQQTLQTLQAKTQQEQEAAAEESNEPVFQPHPPEPTGQPNPWLKKNPWAPTVNPYQGQQYAPPTTQETQPQGQENIYTPYSTPPSQQQPKSNTNNIFQ